MGIPQLKKIPKILSYITQQEGKMVKGYKVVSDENFTTGKWLPVHSRHLLPNLGIQALISLRLQPKPLNISWNPARELIVLSIFLSDYINSSVRDTYLVWR